MQIVMPQNMPQHNLYMTQTRAPEHTKSRDIVVAQSRGSYKDKVTVYPYNGHTPTHQVSKNRPRKSSSQITKTFYLHGPRVFSCRRPCHCQSRPHVRTCPGHKPQREGKHPRPASHYPANLLKVVRFSTRPPDRFGHSHMQ